MQVNIGITHVNNSECEKLLGIKIDCKLSFENHIGKISKKTGAKLDASTRLAQNINTKKCLIRNTFLLHINYCPFTWIFHNRLLNHKINRLHEIFFLAMYNVIHSSSVSTHHKNLQILVTDMFTVCTGSAINILSKVFPRKSPSNYTLRNQQEFTVTPMKAVKYDFISLVYKGSNIWKLLPNNSKLLESVETFKSKIKSWIPNKFQCRIPSRLYIK